MSLAQGLLAVMITLDCGVFTSYRQIHIPQFNLHNPRAIFRYLDKGGQKLNNLYFYIEVLENFK